MANDYKDTLFLPKTDFPMRANLSQREPEFLGSADTSRHTFRATTRTGSPSSSRFSRS